MILKTQQLTVTSELTAERQGSGLLPVYATPAVVALMESTACMCIEDLPDGYTTVGVHIDIQHEKATKVGDTVSCTACLKDVIDDKKFCFLIRVVNSDGEEIAIATHERVRVHAERFMSKL